MENFNSTGKKVIYIDPNCEDFSLEEFEHTPNDEKLHIAKNTNGMHVYSLDGFQEAFNNEYISDLGYIFII